MQKNGQGVDIRGARKEEQNEAVKRKPTGMMHIAIFIRFDASNFLNLF